MSKNGGDYQLWELIDVSDQKYPNTYFIKNVATSRYLKAVPIGHNGEEIDSVYLRPGDPGNNINPLSVSTAWLDSSKDTNPLKWTREGNTFKSVSKGKYLCHSMRTQIELCDRGQKDWILQ